MTENTTHRDYAHHAADQDLLERFGFDRDCFERNRARLVRGENMESINSLRGRIELVGDGAIQTLPDQNADDYRSLRTTGEQLIGSGKVGVIIMAGGMATRFGGKIKALVEVRDGKTFLELKLRQIEKLAERIEHRTAAVPVYLMTSFATHNAIADFAQSYASPYVKLHVFSQFISIRVNQKGEIVHDSDGRLSLYAPGHGDLGDAFRASGLLASFLQRGGMFVYTNNVDNLGASLDSVLVGLHARAAQRGAGMTVEVTPKHEGDQGGGPVVVDGVPQIVEAFRFPSSFRQQDVNVFNTNSFLITAERLTRSFPLDWFVATKKVDDRTVVQFERLVGQLTAFIPCAFVHVERRGAQSRFIPIKTPEDLNTHRRDIEEVLRAQHVLDEHALPT